MPCWYWQKSDIENSPSRKAGISPDNERRYRREGAKFIYNLVQQMKLNTDTFASAAVFYHRFYQIHSFSKFRARFVTATCCLFLAGKVEETPKKYADLIRGAKHVLSAGQYAQFGTFEEAKEELMAMERVLLQTIKFDFHVEHAHKYIIQYCEKLKEDLLVELSEERLNQIVQQSFNFANDSYYTSLSIQWEPQIIAISMIYLAGKIQKVESLAYKSKWWYRFIDDMDKDLIEMICHKVLDLYTKSSKTPGKQKSESIQNTPANKKLKLNDGNSATPKADVQKQLQSLLKNIPAETIKNVIESGKSNPATPTQSKPEKKLEVMTTSTGSNQQNQPTQSDHSRPTHPNRYHTPQQPKRNSKHSWSTPQPMSHQSAQMSHQTMTPSMTSSNRNHQGEWPKNNQSGTGHYQQSGWPDEGGYGRRGHGRNNYKRRNNW